MTVVTKIGKKNIQYNIKRMRFSTSKIQMHKNTIYIDIYTQTTTVERRNRTNWVANEERTRPRH